MVKWELFSIPPTRAVPFLHGPRRRMMKKNDSYQNRLPGCSKEEKKKGFLYNKIYDDGRVKKFLQKGCLRASPDTSPQTSHAVYDFEYVSTRSMNFSLSIRLCVCLHVRHPCLVEYPGLVVSSCRYLVPSLIMNFVYSTTGLVDSSDYWFYSELHCQNCYACRSRVRLCDRCCHSLNPVRPDH